MENAEDQHEPFLLNFNIVTDSELAVKDGKRKEQATFVLR